MGRWQGNRRPDNQSANKLVDAGGIWFEDVGSTPTASNGTNHAGCVGDGRWDAGDGESVDYVYE